MLSLTHIHFEPAGDRPRAFRPRVAQWTPPPPIRRTTDFAQIPFEFRQVLERSGIEMCAYKEPALARRCKAWIRRSGAPSLEAAARLISSQPALIDQVPDTFLLGVTSFFRDPQVWNDIEAFALPGLQTCQEQRVL